MQNEENLRLKWAWRLYGGVVLGAAVSFVRWKYGGIVSISTKMSRKWHDITTPWSLKLEERANASGLLDMNTANDALNQTKLNAYGQIRAAQITARGAIAAVGIGGTLLWIYQQFLSAQADEIKELKKTEKKSTRQLEQVRTRAKSDIGKNDLSEILSLVETQVISRFSKGESKADIARSLIGWLSEDEPKDALEKEIREELITAYLSGDKKIKTFFSTLGISFNEQNMKPEMASPQSFVEHKPR